MIVQIKDLYGFLENTALFAIKLFDKFVSMNSLVQAPMQPLIAMCCITLAVKMHESCILDFEQAIKLCEQSTGITYVPEMFTQAEFQIFKSLDCELNMPTAFDLLMQVLYLEQDD